MATKAMLTIEDFVRLPESVGEQDVRYELVEGEISPMSPTVPAHNRVRGRVERLLAAFVEQHGLGEVLAEQAFHLFGNTVRIPDVSFVRASRPLDPHCVPEGPPNLAVEVVSPSNTPREIDQRISDYFAAGCQRVWVVHPEDHEVYIHGLTGVTRRRAEDLLEDSELLPGFSAKVSELFA
jgi:Uma2 family endonuclease